MIYCGTASNGLPRCKGSRWAWFGPLGANHEGPLARSGATLLGYPDSHPGRYHPRNHGGPENHFSKHPPETAPTCLRTHPPGDGASAPDGPQDGCQVAPTAHLYSLEAQKPGQAI